MGVVINALTEPSDCVGIFTPVYPPFFKMIEHNHRQCIEMPLQLKEQRYYIDFDLLASQLDQIKVLLLCSPHNPSGRVWSKEELQQLLTLCQEKGVMIFSDEIHSDIIMPDYVHTNLLKLPKANESVILAHSIAKTFNCAGLRASFLVIPNEHLRHRIYKTQLQTHVDEVNIMGKIALSSALSPAGIDYQKSFIDYISKNHELLETHFSTYLPSCRVMTAESTFLSWVDFSGLGLTSKALSDKLIDQAKVGLSQGDFFGRQGQNFQRINVGLQRQRLASALIRISDALS